MTCDLITVPCEKECYKSYTSVLQSKPRDAAWWMWGNADEFKGRLTLHFTRCLVEWVHRTTARIKQLCRKISATHLYVYWWEKTANENISWLIKIISQNRILVYAGKQVVHSIEVESRAPFSEKPAREPKSNLHKCKNTFNDNGYGVDGQPGAMNGRNGWRYRVRKIPATSTIWWW